MFIQSPINDRRGQSFITFARRGRGSSKSVPHAYKGEGGVDTSKYARKKKSLFCSYVVLFSYARYFFHALLCLASTSITFLSNICYDYFPVFQVFYRLFLYEIID